MESLVNVALFVLLGAFLAWAGLYLPNRAYDIGRAVRASRHGHWLFPPLTGALAVVMISTVVWYMSWQGTNPVLPGLAHFAIFGCVAIVGLSQFGAFTGLADDSGVRERVS